MLDVPDLEERVEPDSKKFLVLGTGEFTKSVLDDIRRASDYILLKSFVWRNDEAGRELAEALLEAADGGVKIYIVKDKRGLVYEYGDGNGQSFFHNDLHDSLMLLLQARTIALWYGNRPDFPRNNELREDFVHHENIKVISDFDIRDHSKVVVIDGKIFYLGSANVGNEFHHRFGEDKNRMVDYTARVEGRTEVLRLLKTISGLDDGKRDHQSDIDFSHEHGFQEGDSLQDDLLKYIGEAERELNILMAYHSEPAYLHALIAAVKRGVQLTLVSSHNPDVSRFGNRVFLKKLVNATSDHHDRLTIGIHPGNVHAKIAEHDQAGRIGSQNMVMSRGVLAETVLKTADPKQSTAVKRAINRELSRSTILRGDNVQDINDIYPGKKNYIPALIEKFFVEIDDVLTSSLAGQVRTGRQKTRKMLLEVLREHHGVALH